MIERVKEKLSGKKVLFISAKFYHYGEAVFQKLKSYGADVSFFYERDTSIKHTIVATFFGSYMNKWQERHYDDILKKTENSRYDYLIVIRGYKMPVSFVNSVKQRNPGITSILYEWDSYKTWESDYRPLIPYFDRTLCFDYQDCKDLNIPYASTFHTDEYTNLPLCKPVYDFIFCTNFTDEKYEFVKRFLNHCNEHGYTAKIYLYMSWFRYVKARLNGSNIDKRDIEFKRLDRKDYFELFCQSKTVVDFSGSTQTGLTMRVIDALGSGKRVLTNNPNVVNEPDFNARQVVVYNMDDLTFPEWITKEETFKKKDYSIDKWLDNVLFTD